MDHRSSVSNWNAGSGIDVDRLPQPLAQALRDLALYAPHVSQGNKVKLLSSAFPAQAPSKRESVGKLPPPQNVRMRRTLTSNTLVAPQPRPTLARLLS